MTDLLALNLEFLGQAADGLRFRLQIRNTSSVKLLVPRPAINCLHFGNLTTVVDEDYFCRDSNYRYPDLVWLALQENAIVWKGQAISDRFKVDFE